MNFSMFPTIASLGPGTPSGDYGRLPNGNDPAGANQLGQYLKLWQDLGLNDNWNHNNREQGLYFAQNMLRQQQQPPNFFGSQSFQQGQPAQPTAPQYVQPQPQGSPNPYQPRAMELTGANNYLRNLLGRNNTVGVRG